MSQVTSSTPRQQGILIDSGCTAHLFSNKDYFTSWDTKYKDGECHIVLADGSVSTNAVQGRGTVNITAKDSTGCTIKLTLKDCLYYPNCSYDGIFSINQAMEQDKYSAIFHVDGSYIENVNGDKIPFIQRGKLHFLNELNYLNAAKTTSLKSRTAKQWHSILCHLNYDDVLRLPQLVDGMKITSKEKPQCLPCVQTKMKNKISRKPDKRSNVNFAFVHSDIAGPYSDTGYRWIVTFVDDCSGYVHLYALKAKSDVVEAFRRFLASVRRFAPPGSPRGPVTQLRTDNAMEYLGQEFQQICKDEQIFHQRSPPRCPWANGQAERLFGVLHARVRAALQDAGHVPFSQWFRAFKYAAYIINRSPNHNTGLTPYEKVFGKKPDVSTLAKFGARCEALNPAPPHKLAPRSEPGVFVGFDEHSDAYMVYFPKSKSTKPVNRVIIHDDVQNEQVNQSPEVNDFEGFNLPEVNDFEGFHTTSNSVSTNVSNMQSQNLNVQNCGTCQSELESNVIPYVKENNTSNSVSFVNAINEYCFGVSTVPKSFHQAVKSPDADLWWAAMQSEYDSIVKNDTFDYVKRPDNVKVIPGMWVYAIKKEVDGSTRHKARWVAKGFCQTYGINYTETYAPLARMTTIRIVLFLAVQLGLIAHQVDIKTAFLNAELDHTIYMQSPLGFNNDNSYVCKLKKSLYGLKQSARVWNETMDEFLLSINFRKSKVDSCLYIKVEPQGLTIVILWVDDIIILGKTIILVNNFKTQLKNRFDVKDNGELSYFLGINIKFSKDKVNISQKDYCKDILKRFNMQDCNPVYTPCIPNASLWNELEAHKSDPPLENPRKYRELVGSLLYLQQVSRPDISFITNVLCQQMAKPSQYHWELGLKVLKYLKGTINFGLNYQKVDKMELIGMVDADHANDQDSRKSITGYVFKLSHQSSPISWTTSKQSLVSTSTCNAEYIALSAAVDETLYLQFLLEDMNLKDTNHNPAKLFCDSASCILLANNPCYHPRTKHIDVRHHHIRDHINKNINLMKIPTDENLADTFTKSLARNSFEKYSKILQNI